MTRSLFARMLVGALLCGCSAPRLPPGTPPPEYETRSLPPWPGAAAGAAGSASNRAPEPAEAVSPRTEPRGPAAAGAGGIGPSPSPAVPGE